MVRWRFDGLEWSGLIGDASYSLEAIAMACMLHCQARAQRAPSYPRQTQAVVQPYPALAWAKGTPAEIPPKCATRVQVRSGFPSWL